MQNNILNKGRLVCDLLAQIKKEDNCEIIAESVLIGFGKELQSSQIAAHDVYELNCVLNLIKRHCVHMELNWSDLKGRMNLRSGQKSMEREALSLLSSVGANLMENTIAHVVYASSQEECDKFKAKMSNVGII